MKSYPQTSSMKPTTDYPHAVEPAQNAASEAYLALSEARELSQYVKSLVGRLCGATPEENTGGKGLGSDGFFPSLREVAIETTCQIRTAHAELNRLEREIP